MYIPASFREDRPDVLHALMRAHPLALLVTAGPGGLQASPLPMLLDSAAGERGILRAHMARANPHWRELENCAECLVVFQGPQGYVSPAWYPSKAETGKVVPTWNYATVHAWGKPRLIDDPVWLRRQLDDLTADHEAPRPQPWAPADAPADYLAAQMKAIVGIEIPLARLEGKFKLSQNRDARDRNGVLAGLADAADPHRAPDLRALM